MLTPLASSQWDRAKAAHLLNRAAFGGPPEQIDALAAKGMSAAVGGLIDRRVAPAPAPPPDWANPREMAEFREKMRAAVLTVPAAQSAQPSPTAPTDTAAQMQEKRKDVQKALRRVEGEHMINLGGWWLNRMRDAEDPFEEKMTLFWHGHFATSATKVKNPYVMWRQNQTFREHARGNFGVLTKSMSRDPAMIDWLDLRQSRAAHANENFARELMELFTLGEGHYTEKDVTESARAFTGYRVDPRDQSFVFTPRNHDFTPKQFLNRSGTFHGDQIIDIILEQPACAQFLARKLWTFFAYENPSPEVVDALAATMRTSKYEMQPVLQQLFASQEFYSPRAIGTQVKSPVQFLMQTSRLLDTDLPPTGFMLTALKQLGQTPFAPPSVKGWDGGKAWISTSTLLYRYNLAGALVNDSLTRGRPRRDGRQLRRADPAAMDMVGQMDAAAAMSPAPSAPAPAEASHRHVDLAKLAPPELRSDPAALVRTLAARLYLRPMSPKDEQTFVDYLKSTGPGVGDKSVQGVLHLMMSTPLFQLC